MSFSGYSRAIKILNSISYLSKN